MMPVLAGRQRNLDVLRGLCALGVLAGHAAGLTIDNRVLQRSFPDPVWSFIYHSTMTVLWFFALSGYLIGGPFIRALVHSNPIPNWRRYALRRVARIVPAFWIAFTAFIVLTHPPDATPSAVVVHYFFLQNEVPGQAEAVYSPAWTLGIEAAFYLLVPVAAIVVARTRHRVSHVDVAFAIALLGLFSFIYQLPLHRPADATENLPGTFCFFAPGLMVATIEDALKTGAWKVPPLFNVRPSILLLAGLGSFAAASASWFFNSVVYQLVILGSITLALWAALTAPPWKSPVARGLAYLGLVSYGVYLWHWVIATLLETNGNHIFVNQGALGWLLSAIVLLAMSLVPASVSWYLVERSLIQRSRRGGAGATTSS